MIAVVIPVKDEETTLTACLRAVLHAASHPGLSAEDVTVVCVLDQCSDRSLVVARAAGAECLEVDFGNVGRARHAGAALALAKGARWVAFTDGDSRVHPDWLASQVGAGADVVCGVIELEADDELSTARRDLHARLYSDCEGHRHIHGANLGLSARWYQTCGGFPPLEEGEDVALVQALQRAGARIVWSASARVTTSARLTGRTPGGFAGFLRALSGDAGALLIRSRPNRVEDL